MQQVRLRFTAERAPYVVTKPLHPSQSEAIVTAAGTEVCLQVRLNRELTSLLLGFGADVEVLAPEALRENLRQVVQQMMRQYVV